MRCRSTKRPIGVPTGTTRGDCEPGPQTRFGGPTSLRILTNWPMDAAPIADRKQKEAEVRVSDVVRAQDQAGAEMAEMAGRALLMPAPLS